MAQVENPLAPSTDSEAPPLPLTSVSTALAADIRACGVDHAFGLMADDTLGLLSALEATGIRFHNTRHETQSVAMAEGYSFASGRLGVAVIGRGPAATNALPGAVYASRTGSKVLVIVGDDPITDREMNAQGPDNKRLEGLHSAGVFAAAGVRTFPVTTPDAAQAILAQAISFAELGNAAVVFLPTTVQGAQVEAREQRLRPSLRLRAPEPATAVAIDTAVAVLTQSRRPLIVAGWGAVAAGAREPLEALAERIGAVLATSFKGKDIFRGHPYDLGIVGSFSHSAARRFIDQADCVLVVGAGLNYRTMSQGTSFPSAPVIQVDAVRANIGRWSTVQVALVGDARLVVEQLLATLPVRGADEKQFHSDETRRLLAEFDHTHDFEDVSRPRNIDPRSLGIELDRVLPTERTIVYDAGNFLQVAPYLSVPDPHHVKMANETAAIGMSLGTALGVAKARPDSTTVLVTGDGGLLMTLGDLETAVREDIPLIVVVMNDRAYGAERHILELRDLPIGRSVFPEVDFAGVAEALGYEAYTITSLEDLRAIAPSLDHPKVPVMLDCLINPEVRAAFLTEKTEFEKRK